MIIEGAEIPSGEVIETEICIIGAGAAGITMSLEFTGAPFRVAVLEAGGTLLPLYKGAGVRYCQRSPDARF